MVQEEKIESSEMPNLLDIGGSTVPPLAGSAVSSQRSSTGRQRPDGRRLDSSRSIDPSGVFDPQSPDTLGQSRDSEGRFIYAVILPNGNPVPIHRDGIDLIGLDGCKVYMIPYRDIAAVVSDYPVGQIRLIRKNLSPYHDVTRRLAETCTTIPARFGQIAEDGEKVTRVLRRNYPRIRQELERLDQKVEMGVKVFWEVDNLFEYFVKTDAELRSLRDRIFSRQSPPTTLELIALGGVVSDRMNARKEAVSQKVMSALRRASAEEKLDEPSEEKMVMTGWFLVSKERQQDFEQMVNEAASLLGEKYAVKVNGPWVPFNFVEHIELEM